MEQELRIVVTAIGLSFLAAATIPLLYRVLGERIAYAGAAIAATSFGLLASQLGTSGTVAFSWIPSINVAIRFTVDG